jgi:hypothetical protein
MTFSIKFNIENFDHVAWVFGPYIAAWSYLRSIVTIHAGFLSGQFVGKLFMICIYDAKQQLLSLVFAIIASEESAANQG